MKSFVSAGHNIDFTVPSGGVTSGAVVIMGALVGIASTSGAEGETVAMVTTGVFRLPKASGTAFTAGAKVSWNATDDECDAPGSGLYPIGTAIAAAAGDATAVLVRLDGVATAAAA